ncbi:MAG TPA: hypothetical protein VFB03_00095, partial [Candidatus Saccharimonadales bacterium]|nr:hypothetical protein [Candidatus Saccharimonadales bacterium]
HGTLTERKRMAYAQQGIASEEEDRKANANVMKAEWESLHHKINKDHYLTDLLHGEDNSERHAQEALARGDREAYEAYHGGYKMQDGRKLETRGRSEGEKRAAADWQAQLSGETNLSSLERYHRDAISSGDSHQIQTMRQFFNDNVGQLLPKMTHIYKGDASTADASPQAIAQMHGVEIQSLLSRWINTMNGVMPDGRTATRQDVDNATRNLRKFTANYMSAAQDPTLRGSMEAGGVRMMKAVVSGDFSLVDDSMALRQRRGLDYIDATDPAATARATAAARRALAPTAPGDPDIGAELDRIIVPVNAPNKVVTINPAAGLGP